MYNEVPYFMPAAASKASIFSKINIGAILSNTQKTLSVINQAIPLYYQVKPIVKNLSTLSKIGKELNKNDNKSNTITNNDLDNNVLSDKLNNSPQFFM